MKKIFYNENHQAHRRIHKESESRKNIEKTLDEFEDFYIYNKKNNKIFSDKNKLIFLNSNLIKRILYLLSKKKINIALKLYKNLKFSYKLILIQKIIILIIKKLINIF